MDSPFVSGDFVGDSVRSLDSRGWALRRVATAAGGTRGNTGRHGWMGRFMW